MESDEELFLAQNSFSHEILQPNFSIDSILDAIQGNDEPAPQNSCAEELKKIVPDESIKGGPKAVRVVIKMGILKPIYKPVNFNHCTFVTSKDFKLN